MPNKIYYSYIRVSTQRQGQNGTSLAEQKAAIEHYAARFGLTISKQFEERETAAKQGRPVFLEMLMALKKGKANGIIVHKIDRSARNLKDWADLGSLIDRGIEVHFANENLDLNSRGGRLSADIQAVVASDYIRNLREETKKGIYGRLKQGLYPFPARVGYLDKGKGKPKSIDPVQGPLVKQAFEHYATGKYGLNASVEKMFELGLRNKNGRKISRNGLVCILKNPFYMGVINIRSIGELFVGIHDPIISKVLFDQVQNVFAGKRIRKQNRHFFVFRRTIVCLSCQYLLIAERKKGHVYYRCHTKACNQKTVREELIENQLLQIYRRLQLTDEEYQHLHNEAEHFIAQQPQRIEAIEKQLQLEQSQIKARLAKLADAYVDEVFDKETYLTKKNELIFREQEIKEKIAQNETDVSASTKQLLEFLELLKSVYISYKLANDKERRDMVKITTSNFTIEGKTLLIKLRKPFQTVLERERFPVGSPKRATTRTLSPLLSLLLDCFRNSNSENQDMGLAE